MSQRSRLTAWLPLLILFSCFTSIPAAHQQPQGWGSPGVVAVLTDIAGAGTTVLRVNRDNKIDEDARVLVKSRDGATYEVHYIARIEGLYLYLKTPLKNAYSSEDLLIQGCDCDRALGLPANGVVGTLDEEVAAKTSVLKFTPIVPLDVTGDLLIKRKDGSFEEVHDIKSYDGSGTLRIHGKLKHDFHPGDMLIQGCLVPRAAAGVFPWNKLLLGGAGGAATIVVITIVNDCDACPE